MAQINEKDIVWDDKPILDETQIVWDDAPVKKKDATINSNNGFATSSNSASQSKSQSQNKLASNQISPDFSLNLGFPIQKPTINLKTTEQEQSVVGSGVLKSQLPFNNFANVDEIVQEAKTKKTNTENKPIITQYKPKPTVNQQHIADTEQYNPILAEALKGFYGEQGATTTPQTSYSTYDIAKKMTTEQLININNDVFKDVVSQSKGKQQTEFLKESDKNNPVQAFNRESEIYDARIKELKERAGAYESALSSRYGATDFMDTLKKQLADVQQKSKQYEMYVQKRSKEVVALQTELENLKQQAESGTQPREVIEPAFMAKLAQLKAIQSDDEQRRAEIEKIQSDFNSKVSDTDFDMYVQLYNKANELQAEQQGLIMKPEFAEYRKLVDANMKAQIKKDAIKQDYQKKGILGKALDVTKGLALSFNPVALSSTILGGSSLDDISFTASRISDEGDKLAMRTLNAIAAVPKSLEKLNPIGDPNKYDVLDELFDSALYSTKKSEMLNPTATDVQRDIIQKYAIVDGYKVLLDEKGKPTNDVRAKDGFYKVGDKTSEQILQKYTENPKVYKVKEDFSVSTLTTKATPTMLDMGTMMAVTAMTGGSSAAMVGTAAAQMYGGFYESGLQSGLTPQEANDFATITSILTGMVTLVNPMEANIVKGTVSEGIGSIIGKGISKADVQLIRTGKMSIGQYAKRLVKEGVKNTLGENLEEVVLEPAVQRAMEIMYSRNTEQNGGLGFEGLKNDFFDKKQTIETAMITTMASLIMTPVEVANSVPEQRKLALQKALENPQEFIEQRNNMLNGGDYTKEKYDFEVKAFEEISKQYNAVAPEIREDLRDDLSELLLKKYTLKNTMSQVNDEVLNKKNQALLDDVNKRLEEVANGTYDKAKEKVISDAVKQPTPIENDKVATYNGMEVDILDVMPDGMILINTNNPEIGDNGYLEVKRNEITDIKDKPIVTQNEVVPPPIPNENVNANEQQNVEQATAVNIRTEEFDSQTSIDKSIALLPKPQIKKLGIIDKGLDNVFGKIGGGASLSEMTDSNNKKAQDTYDNRVEFIKNNKMFADYYSQASSSQREHLENMIDYYVYNKEEYNPNDVHKYSFVRDNGDVSFTGKGLSSRVEDFKNTPRDKNGYIDWDNAKFSIISPEGKVLKSAIKAEDEDVVLREENNKYNLTPKVNIVNNDKPVIEKIEEVNVPQETVITETVDESTAVPASEMDEQQLNQIFEEKIANPTAVEQKAKPSPLDIFNKRGIVKNETEITPNELIEQGREQDVSQGLQGEYQNNQGVQQSSGIGQVSQQEDVAEKVEEKVDEILSTKNEEITPKSSIEVDRNVDRVDNNQENIETSSDVEAKKAEIERRRQEELDRALSDVNELRQADTVYKAQVAIVKATQESSLPKAVDTAGMIIGESVSAKSSTDIISVAKRLSDAIEKIQKPQVDKINAKYDAELAELEKQQPPQGKGEGDWSAEQQRIENDKTLSAEQKEKAKIESTAKTLSEISKTEIDKNRSIKNAEKIDGTGSHIKNMSLSELNELARDMVKNEKEYQDKLSDAQGVYNLVVEKIDEISEAYHKAKADGSNPELVKAVEDVLGENKPALQSTAKSFTPIDKTAFEKLLDKLKKAFPNVKVELFAKNDFENAKKELQDKGIAITDTKTKDGTIYGFKTPDGKVFINTDSLNANTPIHEFGHIWQSVFPQEFAKGIALLTQSPQGRALITEIQKNPAYKGKSIAEIQAEALVTAIGNKGEAIFNSNPTLFAKFKEWLSDFFKAIGDKLGIKNLSADDKFNKFTKDVVGELLGGKVLSDEVGKDVNGSVKFQDSNDIRFQFVQGNQLKDVVSDFKEAGYTYDEMVDAFKEQGHTYNEKELKDAWNGSDNSGNTKQAQQEDGVKKRVVTERVYEGTVRDEVKSELEKLGLYRDKISQEERAKQADTIIDRIGEEMALEAVKNFDIRGAVATSVLARLIKRIDDKMINLSATDVDELSALAKEQAELIELMGKEAYFGGEYNAQLGYEYLNSDIGYNVDKKIQEFKDQNNGVIPEDVEKKFRELDAQYQQLKKDYAEAEKRAIEAEQKQAVENIKESIKREKKIRTYSKRGDDLIAEGLDELASYLGTKLMAEGTNRPQLTKALSKIGKGLIDKGIATIDNVFDKVKEYVASKFGDKVQIDDLKDDIVKGIIDKMPKATIRDGKISVPHQLIRELVESGIEDINDLAKEIQNRLKGQYPDVEIREIRDAITGYGKTVNPNREEIEKQIRKMKRIGKIESALEDVRNKKRPLRSGVQRDKLETEERARLKELREAMKDLPMDEQTLERELKTQLDAEKTRVQNRIDDLQREIDKNELTPRNARTLKEDTELKALKEKLESVKKEHDEKFKNDDYKEKKRLELSKKLTQNRINELQRRLRENDFSKTVRKPLIADTELIRLKAEKLRIQEEFDKEFYKNELKNRTKAEKLKDFLLELWGLTRALRATGEASFVGIQGLVNTISHPTHAKEAFKTAFKTMRSEKYTEDFLRGIKSQEWYPALKGSKLSLTEPHAELSAREELFVSDWFTYLWNALGTPLKANEKAFETWKSANPLKAVERAAVGYLDTLRVMRFLDGMEMLKMKGQTFENNPQAYKDMADVINTLTGRASLGRLEQNADMLSKVFFSPRNWASMLKQTVLLPRQLYKWRDKTPDAKLTEISVANKMVLSDLSKFVGLTTAMVAMFAAGLNNDDDDETGVELDPRSSDFAKIKIGNKRIDPWGGRIQQVVLLSKLIMDSVKNSKGEIVPLGVPYKSPTKEDLLLRMATNKLSPSMALVNEYLLSTVKFDKQTGEKIRMSPYEYGGGEYDFTDKLLESTYPIYWSTVYDLIKDDANALNGILAFYAFFGGGVNVYDDKKKDKNNTKTNPTEKDIPFIKK